jgi:hypothetical protein
MAQIIPVFDLVSIGNGTVTTETWVDLTSFGPDINSPIPNGKQLLLGYLTVISHDKALTFQVRPNLPTKSLGNDTDTQLRSFVTVPKEDSKDLDLNFYGQITTLAPVSAASTGVEKLWLKVKGLGVIGAFDFILYYTLY